MMDFIFSILGSLIGCTIGMIPWIITDWRHFKKTSGKIQQLICCHIDQLQINDVLEERIESLSKHEDFVKALRTDYPKDIYVYFPPEAMSHIEYLDGFRPYPLYKKEGEDTLEWGKVESCHGTLHFVFDKSLENKLPKIKDEMKPAKKRNKK